MGGSSKKQTVGYRYFLGIHMILCHGPADKLIRIRVDDKDAWLGASTGGQISVNASDLFGGESREGGVSGTVDVEMGTPTQGQNSYLVSKLGSLVPSFRGVVGIVLRQCYLGVNPYLKKWAFRLQRIHKRQTGIAQWYDEKSETPLDDTLVTSVTYTNFSSWSSNNPSLFKLIDNGIANASGNGENSAYWKTSSFGFIPTNLYCEFDFKQIGDGDPIGIKLRSEDGTVLLSFMPLTEQVTDGLRRAAVNYWDPYDPYGASSHISITASVLSAGCYSFNASIDYENDLFFYTLRKDSYLIAEGSAPLTKPSDLNSVHVEFGRTGNISGANPGLCLFKKVKIDGYVKSGDMNPAHIIRECLTDPDWGMGYQDADIDDTSFIKAADALYEEGMGISLLWDRQTSIEEFIKEIVKHIDAALFVDRQTGKFTLKLIRNDYVLADLLVLNPSNVDKIADFTRPAFGELTNSITVSYWDSATGTDASLTVQDIALSQMQGVTINTTVQYPGFTKKSIASRVAQRDLKTLSTPLISCTIYANRDAASLNIGSCFKLTWPDYDLNEVVMRVTGIAYGDGRTNRVRINCSQDVFSLPETSFIAPTPPIWEDPNADAAPAPYRVVVEAPYYELVQRLGQTNADQQISANNDIGYLIVSAAAPNGAINGRLAVDNGAGYENNDCPMDFCPVGFLTGAVDYDDTVIPLTGFVGSSSVVLGTHAQIGSELVKITAVASNSITVGRGVLDTVPTSHAAGTPVLFWDAFGDSDNVEYVTNETTNVKILPTTGRGTLAIDSAPEDSLTFASRAYKPYPPGNVKVNSSAYPATISSSDALTVSWSHRDRLQQTAGDIVDTTAGNIGPEAGTTYTLEIYKENGTTLLHTESGVSTTSYTYPLAEEISDSAIPCEGSASYQQTVINSSPTAYWRMSEVSGTTMVDSNASYNGTYSNVALMQTGAIAGDTAASFNGTTSYSIVPHDTALNPNAGEYSIEMWAKFTGTDYGMAFGKFSNSSPYPGPTVFFNYAGSSAYAGKIEFRDKSQSGFFVDSASSDLNDGNWRHYVFQRRLVSTAPDVWKLEMYINGIINASTTLSSVEALINTNPIYVGSRDVLQFINGTFDEVAYYVGKSLTPTEVANHYAARNNISSSYRQNGKLRFTLQSARGCYNSYQMHDYTVSRTGYGFNYGERYGS